MNKEQQDLAWSVLPKEFKEEVKKMYCTPRHRAEEYTLLQRLFGVHNLTSDAEGEEMLTVPRKTVLEMFAANKRSKSAFAGTEIASESEQINHVLFSFFGSKCLPDNVDGSESDSLAHLEPKAKSNFTPIPEKTFVSNWDKTEQKPAEPKFKIGDKVKHSTHPHDDGIYRVDDIKKSSDGFIYHIQGLIGISNVKESDLEPYTELDTSHETPVCENHSDNTSQKEANVNSNRNLSQNIANCDKEFDNILKDSLSKERRLNIATQMIKAIMQCPEIVERIASAEADSLLDDILHDALYLTDRLMSECEKGGSK